MGRRGGFDQQGRSGSWTATRSCLPWRPAVGLRFPRARSSLVLRSTATRLPVSVSRSRCNTARNGAITNGSATHDTTPPMGGKDLGQVRKRSSKLDVGVQKLSGGATRKIACKVNQASHTRSLPRNAGFRRSPDVAEVRILYVAGRRQTREETSFRRDRGAALVGPGRRTSYVV